MDNIILNSYSKISDLNVSRETCNDLESLITMIQEKNKEINIISKKMFEKESIRERHIIDSAQIIDFVDLNSNTTSDLGSGGGMPGLIVAIVMKKLRSDLELIRKEELQKALSRMGPDFSARERKVVEALTKGIINKILHTPVTKLRSPQSREERQASLKIVEKLFSLIDDDQNN